MWISPTPAALGPQKPWGQPPSREHRAATFFLPWGGGSGLEGGREDDPEGVWTRVVCPAAPGVQAATLLGKDVAVPCSASSSLSWQNESTAQNTGSFSLKSEN